MDTSKPIYIILEILFCFIFVTSCKIQHETIVVSSCNKNYIMRIPTGYQLTTFIGYHGDDCNVYCYPNDGHNAIIYIYPAKAMVDNSGILLGKLVYHYYGQDIFFPVIKKSHILIFGKMKIPLLFNYLVCYLLTPLMLSTKTRTIRV